MKFLANSFSNQNASSTQTAKPMGKNKNKKSSTLATPPMSVDSSPEIQLKTECPVLKEDCQDCDCKSLSPLAAIAKPLPDISPDISIDDIEIEEPAIIAKPAEDSIPKASKNITHRASMQVTGSAPVTTFNRTSYEDPSHSKMSESLYARVFGRRAIPRTVDLNRPGTSLFA